VRNGFGSLRPRDCRDNRLHRGELELGGSIAARERLDHEVLCKW